MGLRREAVNISAEGHSTGGMQFQAEVEALEPDFVHRLNIIYLRMGQLAFSSLCSMDMKLQVGRVISIEFNPERLYFFDTKSGKRL